MTMNAPDRFFLPDVQAFADTRALAIQNVGVKGLRYPFRFQSVSGGTQISASTSREHEHIRESILQILGTRIGERFMNPEFGSRLKDLVFEQNDEVLKGLLRHYVIDAIKRWEKRVIITEVRFDDRPLNIDGNLLLVHGMADDNVHFQNCAEYAEQLVQLGKQFDMQVYTNRNHSIYGGNTRLHLYTRLTNFFNKELK